MEIIINRLTKVFKRKNKVKSHINKIYFEVGKFYPMTIHPPKDGKEPFSALVLVYDESDSRYFDIGYYDFERKKWSVFGEEPMNLKCWCHAPDPSEYLADKKYPLHSIS